MDDTDRERLLAIIREQSLKNNRTRESAKAALIRSGYLGADGKLSPIYGGKTSPRGNRHGETA
jgi:hypothetical protein